MPPKPNKKLAWVKPAPESTRNRSTTTTQSHYQPNYNKTTSQSKESVPRSNSTNNNTNDSSSSRNGRFGSTVKDPLEAFVTMKMDEMNLGHFEHDAQTTAAQKEESRKKESSLKLLANETSAHGVKNVLSGNKYRRVTWFLAVVAAMIFLTYNLVTVFVDYSNYPFQTIFKLTPKSSIVFPGVTICPLNQLDSSKVEHSKELENILSAFSEGFFRENNSLHDVEDQYPYNQILNSNYWDLMKNATPTVEDTFVRCQWQMEDLDCSKHMSYINTPTGRCYQFNVHEEETLQALRPGSRGGFSAVLHLNQDGYSVSERDAAGFKILLHDQYDYPDVFSRGQYFGPGFSYDVSFRKEQFSFLSSPHKAYEASYCSDHFPDNYTGSTEAYSMKSCIHHQDSILTAQKCGCNENECTVRQYLECYKPSFQQFYDNVTTIENVFACGFACNFAGFLVGVSSVLFPSNKALGVIARQLNASENTFRESYLELNLYFEDLLVRESIHQAVYGNWFNIMAMLGGNMGLFLGASLLTMVELVEVVVFMTLMLLLKFPGFFKRSKATSTSTTNIKDAYVKY